MQSPDIRSRTLDTPSAEELGRIFRHLHRLTPCRMGKSARRVKVLHHARFRFGTTRPDEETAQEIFMSLAHGSAFDWRERIVAAWTLGRADLTPEQQQIARQRLGDLVRGKTREGRMVFDIPFGTLIFYSFVWFCGCIGAAVAQAALIGLISSLVSPIALQENPLWTALGNGLAFTAISTLAFTLLSPIFGIYRAAQQRNRTRSVRVESARALGRIGGVGGVSALLHASRNPLFFNEVGKRSLEAVLPCLTEADYGTLEADAVPTLCLLLDPRNIGYRNSEEAWQLLLLDALAKVGNAHALKPLEQYRQHQSNLLLTNYADRAALALSTIEARLVHETERVTLLRGSESPVDPKTLLRPSKYTASNEEEKQLLRPTQGD